MINRFLIAVVALAVCALLMLAAVPALAASGTPAGNDSGAYLKASAGIAKDPARYSGIGLQVLSFTANK